MALTETKIKIAKPEAKPYKLPDERGLHLLVTPQGGKWWRFRYCFDGKEKLLSLGTYPDIGLKDARGTTSAKSGQCRYGTGKLH